MRAIPSFIRERGFMKWYERELVRGHSHLVLLVLCTLALLGALEAYSQREGSDRWLMVASFATAGMLGVWSLRRYLFHLMRAENIANQAVCPECKTYARWLIESDEPADDAAGRPAVMAVCCRKCGGRWRIDC